MKPDFREAFKALCREHNVIGWALFADIERRGTETSDVCWRSAREWGWPDDTPMDGMALDVFEDVSNHAATCIRQMVKESPDYKIVRDSGTEEAQ